MGADSNGTLVSRSPRGQLWPHTTTQQAAANALMLDPTLGLWVPQQSQFVLRQDYTASPNAGVAAPNAIYEPTITETTITNPSATMTMGVQLDLEWQVTTNGTMAGAEMWGFYDFPGTALFPVSPPWGPLVSVNAGAPFWWHDTVSRTVRFTLGPGLSTTPNLRWGFKNIVPAGAGTQTPNLVSWRMSMIGFGYLVYPVAIG